MFSAVIIVILLWEHVVVESIRIKELQVPGIAAEGGQALLGCQFDLEGDDLYSVKWYKDGKEFYRYVPSNDEVMSHFTMPGVFVDVTHSSSTMVALEHLTKDSAGLYRCEVSGEAPYFVTVYKEKAVNIHLLPNKKPRVRGLQNEYSIGDLLEANCTSTRSRPKTQVMWLINDQMAAKKYTRGPWERVSRERADARETTLELRFFLLSHHFRDGVLTVKCQAALPPLYQDEVIHHILRIDPAVVADPIPIDAGDDLEAPPPIYQTPVLSENTGFLPATGSLNEEDAKDNSGRNKFSVWVIIPSTFVLLFLL
ncbi:uncharacterized protein LOC112044789 [Bicyclus anynana]|uniref:Uncharacterized protein LOC112044789 n=1 Tax=Bicyclus anynana TaxID=110368 RepID=A0A6J1MLX0_BICAN|nr:uncharacterized protein LOC112044789 [Bicyclus anynana]